MTIAVSQNFPDYDFDKDQEIFPEIPSKPDLIGCSYCNKGFSSKQLLELHQVFQHKILPYKCPKKNCSKSFFRAEYLKEHINMVHKGGRVEKSYKCDKTQKCVAKGTAFKTQGELNRHLHRHGPKDHTCPQCDKSFAIKSDLEGHVRIHTNEKIFACRNEGCDEAFISSSRRLWHEKNFHK
jgi:KRAB domain-containing zinc finger protein